LPHKLKMIDQICAGMIVITSMEMIHRDLATRNILVFAFYASNPAATRVKITDFGLSVDRHYQTHAYGAQNEDVPIRWMPPEALKKRRLTEKRDISAFAVTAWEVLTDGEVPYGFIASTEAVAERVCVRELVDFPHKRALHRGLLIQNRLMPWKPSIPRSLSPRRTCIPTTPPPPPPASSSPLPAPPSPPPCPS
jgi:serine/threonine protein kinase